VWQHQPDLSPLWEERGFLHWRNDSWDEYFPDIYHTSFHLSKYIHRHWRENTGDHRTLYATTHTSAIEVDCVRVDDLLDPAWPVDLIKIDIQGSEHLALRGMERTLATYRPLIIAEFWPAGIIEAYSSPREVLAYYHGLSFSVSLIERPDLDAEKSGEETVVEAAGALPGGFGSLLLTSRLGWGRKEIREKHQ
jgi:hypothetical protein